MTLIKCLHLCWTRFADKPSWLSGIRRAVLKFQDFLFYFRWLIGKAIGRKISHVGNNSSDDSKRAGKSALELKHFDLCNPSRWSLDMAQKNFPETHRNTDPHQCYSSSGQSAFMINCYAFMIVWDIVMLASLPFFVPVIPEKQKKRLILCSAAAMIMQTKSNLELVNANLFLLPIYQTKNQVQLCFSEPRRLSSIHVMFCWLIDFSWDHKTNVTSQPALQEFELCFSFISFSLMNFNAGLMQQSTFYIFSIFKLSAFFVGCILRATLLIFRGFFYGLRWNFERFSPGTARRSVGRWKMSNASLNSLLRLL